MRLTVAINSYLCYNCVLYLTTVKYQVADSVFSPGGDTCRSEHDSIKALVLVTNINDLGTYCQSPVILVDKLE